MIEIPKCLGYINDFKLYNKWTGEINKAIAYRKLKKHPSDDVTFQNPSLPRTSRQGLYSQLWPRFCQLINGLASGVSPSGLTLGFSL